MTLALATLTFRECSRRSLPYVVGVTLIFIVLASRLFLAFTFGHEREESLNLAISGVFLAGFLVAAFQGTALIRRDLERGTLAMLMTKPIGLAQYLSGRLAGLFGVSCLAGAIVATGAAASLVLIEGGRTADIGWLEVFAASARALPPVLVLCSAALAVSTLASRALAPVALLAIFLAGSLAGPTRAGSLLPDFALFSLDANASAPGTLALLYALVFSSLFLVLAYIFLALRALRPG